MFVPAKISSEHTHPTFLAVLTKKHVSKLGFIEMTPTGLHEATNMQEIKLPETN